MNTASANSEKTRLSRRDVLRSAPAFVAASLLAQQAPAALLPLQTTELEHLGMTVPDPKAAADFYGRIFDPQLFQEREPPLRYYVRLGSAYIAFGSATDPRSGADPNLPTRIDHFCVLVNNYQPRELRTALEQAGINMGQGRFGLPTDADGIRLQVAGTPGGLTRTVIPGPRLSADDAAVEAIGLDHIVLAVSDLDRSSAYYTKLFGPPASRSKKPERIWFQIARQRLALEPVAAGAKPAIQRLCVKIAGFNRHSIPEKLKKLGIEILPKEEEHLVSFRDLNGFLIDLAAET
ncbi:MAG TPA: VOC family protein [Bryobacteraceae bacterium]|nr:VOC family protein [Bryobacteraceae bacterium]